MRFGLAIIVGLPLAASVAFGQKTLFPTNRNETIIAGGGGGRSLALPHNACDTIAQEVQGQEVYKLLLRILKLPDDTRVRYLVADCHVQVSTLGLKRETAEAFAVLVREYVSSRGSGHTAQYVLDSLKHRLVPSQAETNGYRAALFEAFPNLPRDWVREDPFQSKTLTTNSLLAQWFVVVDGEVAWTYIVPLGNSRAGGFKVDAKEFDPMLRPKFNAAREEAEENLKKRGIKKGFGYLHHFEAEVDAILRQKYQIKRRSFGEPNPGIIRD